MSELDHVQDYLQSGLVLIVILFIVLFCWTTTYVRDYPLVSATVVVLQEESSTIMSSSSSTSSNSAPTDRSISNQSSGDASNASVLMDMSTSSTSKGENSDSHVAASPISSSEKGCSEDTSVEKQKNTEPPTPKKCSCMSDDSSHDAQNCSCESLEHPCLATDGQEESDKNADETACSSESDNDIEDISARQPPLGSIKIKLIFLDETQKIVHGQLTDDIGSFKLEHFSEEISSNCIVRLIFNGQLLNQDSTTLGQYGLFDNCAVHCQISQASSRSTAVANNNSVAAHQGNDLDLSELMVPLLVGVTCFLWYLRYEYSALFNNFSTFVLICFSLLLIVPQYASLYIRISMALTRINLFRSSNTIPSEGEITIEASINSPSEEVLYVLRQRHTPEINSAVEGSL